MVSRRYCQDRRGEGVSAVNLTNPGKSFGARTLFADVNLHLEAERRYGLVGANGSGKTTLLKILAGDEQPSEGNVGMAKGTRLGVLRQDRFLDDAQTIVHLAMMGDEVVWKALQDHERLLAEAKAEEAAEVEEL